MWFQHLNDVQKNRRKGATKAAETRRKNQKGKTKDKERNVWPMYLLLI